MKKPAYKASIKVLGKTFTAEGKTVSDAITNLKPGNIKGKSILVISKGKLTKERVLTPFLATRLFNLSPTMREVALKNTALMFDL